MSDIIYLTIPDRCPICGQSTKIVFSDSGVKNLICENPQCEGKIINQLEHYFSKSGLDIRGLSKKTLEKLIDWEWVTSPEDIFTLEAHRKDWENKSGFGAQSVKNILDSIEKSKHTTFAQFIVAIGIPLIGKSQSKEIIKICKNYEDFREKVDSKYDWSQIDTFGEVKSQNINNFNYEVADKIYKYLIIEENNTANTNNVLEGLNFVITGSVHNWKNRDELKSFIEAKGGKVLGSVSKNTSYLINNDIESNSGKNKKAKELGIPIISEENFLKKFDLL